MRTKHVLSADDAAKIIAGCKAEAEKNKWPVSVAVVDDSGRILSQIRFDGAGYGTPDVAFRKAQTSAMTRAPSADAEKLTIQRPSMLSLTDRLPLMGGVPVMFENECLGAVGVSGVLSEQDEQVAKAGVISAKFKSHQLP